MKQSNPETGDTESILIALDQVSQTIDVLSSTVKRLKQCVTHNLDGQLTLENEDESNYAGGFVAANNRGPIH